MSRSRLGWCNGVMRRLMMTSNGGGSSSGVKFMKPLSYTLTLGTLGVVGGLTTLLVPSLYRSPLLNEAAPNPDEKVEPVTQVTFKTKLTLPDDIQHEGDFELVGYGVRTVTFLKFTAYAVGLYFDKSDLKRLESSQWKNQFSSEKFMTDPNYADQFISYLLKQNVRMALCIVPVKATSGSHLKGGLTRNLTNYLTHQLKNQTLTVAEGESVKAAIQDFGHAFPKGTLPIFSQLLFIRAAPRPTTTLNPFASSSPTAPPYLRVVDQGVDKGTISHPWLGDTLLTAYLNGTWIVSNELRQSFADTIQAHLNPSL